MLKIIRAIEIILGFEAQDEVKQNLDTAIKSGLSYNEIKANRESKASLEHQKIYCMLELIENHETTDTTAD